MKLVLLGAPGAGKSTQARSIAEHFAIARVTMSEVINEFLEKDASELGEKIRAVMAAGGLVGDELVLELVESRLRAADCANGYVFDGFPRNTIQAKAYTAMDNINAAVYINTPDSVIIERISGRVVCTICGRMYSANNPSKTENFCDDCGARLTQRADDTPDAVENRLKVYHELTTPVIEFYRRNGKLLEVDGTKEITGLTADIVLTVSGGGGHGNIG